jgi:hypothetical protein
MIDFDAKNVDKHKQSQEDPKQLKCYPKRGTNQPPYQIIEHQLRKDAHFWPPITTPNNSQVPIPAVASLSDIKGVVAAATTSADSPDQVVKAALIINENISNNNSTTKTTTLSNGKIHDANEATKIESKLSNGLKASDSLPSTQVIQAGGAQQPEIEMQEFVKI